MKSETTVVPDLQRFEQREQSEACFNYAESQKTTKSLESGTQ